MLIFQRIFKICKVQKDFKFYVRTRACEKRESGRQPLKLTPLTSRRRAKSLETSISVHHRLVLTGLPKLATLILELKAAFHFRVFHTHVYAHKTLNPSILYIF